MPDRPCTQLMIPSETNELTALYLARQILNDAAYRVAQQCGETPWLHPIKRVRLLQALRKIHSATEYLRAHYNYLQQSVWARQQIVLH